MKLSANILLLLATRAFASNAGSGNSSYAVKQPPLTTQWTYTAGTNPWPEYPRPQLERSQWKNLNGIWRYESASDLAARNNPPFNSTLSHEVLVPSCLESGLSGLSKQHALNGGVVLTRWHRNPREQHPLLLVLHVFYCSVGVERKCLTQFRSN